MDAERCDGTSARGIAKVRGRKGGGSRRDDPQGLRRLIVVKRRSLFSTTTTKIFVSDSLTLEQVLVDLLAVLLGDQHDACLFLFLENEKRWRRKVEGGE